MLRRIGPRPDGGGTDAAAHGTRANASERADLRRVAGHATARLRALPRARLHRQRRRIAARVGAYPEPRRVPAPRARREPDPRNAALPQYRARGGERGRDVRLLSRACGRHHPGRRARPRVNATPAPNGAGASRQYRSRLTGGLGTPMGYTGRSYDSTAGWGLLRLARRSSARGSPVTGSAVWAGRGETWIES